MRKFIFLLAVAILCSHTAFALEINLAKDSYLSGETFQANITADFYQPLTVKNVFFMNSQEQEVQLAFYLVKISEKEYWVYVDLPSQKGNYSFEIKNMLYKEEGVLKGETRKANFEINSGISSLYGDIVSKTNGKFSSLSIKDNSLALLALAYDSSLSTQAKNTLMGRKSSSSMCWPASPCNIKDTALSLYSLKKYGSTGIDTSWFIDAQNNLEIGLWSLVVNSPLAGLCDFYINSDKKELNLTSGSNVIAVDLKSKPDEVILKTNCSLSSAKITHTYLGKINEFQMQADGNISSITLNNKKCFGNSYRSDCDIESTAYAILALDAFGLDKSKAVEWLKENAVLNREKAIAMYFGASEFEEFFLNNQHEEGYWAQKSLIESDESDIESTIFSVWALQKAKENEAANRGKQWLKNNLYGNLSNELIASAFVFPNSEIESILAVSPAIIITKINSSISISLKNKGVTDLAISATLSPFNSKKDIALQKSGQGSIDFTIPDKIGKNTIKGNVSGNIAISYNKFTSGSYNIPVLVISNKEDINETPIEIPKEHFRFSLSEINATLKLKEKSVVPITIKNLASSTIKDVSLSYSRDIGEIITLMPSSIGEIDAGGEATVNIIFESSKLNNYTGYIEASSSNPRKVSAMLPINITFTKNESQVTLNKTLPTANLTCKNYNGTICSVGFSCTGKTLTAGDGICCVGKCEKKKNFKMLGVIMIVLAILIIVLSIAMKMKKPKQEMKNVVAQIEKKYDKFTDKRKVI